MAGDRVRSERFSLSALVPSGGLLQHLLVGLAVFAVVFLIWWAFGLRLSLVPFTVFTLLVAALVWLVRRGPEPATTPTWVEHQALIGSPRFQSDLATRRLADTIAGAQPGREFSNHQLSAVLRDLAAARLVASHHADPADPLSGAEGLLSPGLLRYLRTADGGTSPSMTRRTLHRHLKEIQRL